MEEKPHISPEYTKPFTFTVPMGLNEGKNTLASFLKLRNEGIGFIDTTKLNLREYVLRPGRGPIHQVFISTFAPYRSAPAANKAGKNGSKISKKINLGMH